MYLIHISQKLIFFEDKKLYPATTPFVRIMLVSMIIVGRFLHHYPVSYEKVGEKPLRSSDLLCLDFLG